MSHTTYFVPYKLKKGTSVQEFSLATEALNNEYISKQKGYISWKQLTEGDMWGISSRLKQWKMLKKY